MGERVLCKHEVVGSIPSASTTLWRLCAAGGRPTRCSLRGVCVYAARGSGESRLGSAHIHPWKIRNSQVGP